MLYFYGWMVHYSYFKTLTCYKFYRMAKEIEQIDVNIKVEVDNSGKYKLISMRSFLINYKNFISDLVHKNGIDIKKEKQLFVKTEFEVEEYNVGMYELYSLQ